jgi:hypothetical protein
LPCLDQKQAGSAPVSRSRAGQSADGDALGLPYLQPATVDPLAQTAAHASHGLDSENRRVRKRRNRYEQHRLKRQNLSRATKTNLRETFLHSFFLKGAGLDAASRQPPLQSRAAGSQDESSRPAGRFKTGTKRVCRNWYRSSPISASLNQFCPFEQLFSPRIRATFERKLKYETVHTIVHLGSLTVAGLKSLPGVASPPAARGPAHRRQDTRPPRHRRFHFLSARSGKS